MGSLPTIREIQSASRQKATYSSELVDRYLTNIQSADGEGSRTFIKVHTKRAQKLAEVASILFASGEPTLPLAGIPISIKDLFDEQGHATSAGSVVLRTADPSLKDATIVNRLRQAGAIIIGRTNMTEFAYSGVGLNPHYGTPASPFDRRTRRIPGGSSSGSGVSVSDHMAAASIGTDTGGSVRIPAALCGIVGFKPTARRVPTDGVFPLSSTFDSVGPLAPTVQCCAYLDQVMRGDTFKQIEPYPLKNLRVAIPKGLPIDGLDDLVTSAFERSLRILQDSGVTLHETRVPAIESTNRASSGGLLLAAEAYSIHRHLLEKRTNDYDPRVATRILPAASTSAAEYIDLSAWRKDFVLQMKRELNMYDAFIMPTTPITAPPIADLEQSDDVYFNTNTTMLRNTSIVNQMDGCALSLPCHLPGESPVGLMVAGLPMQDEKILQIGLAIEEVLKYS